MSVTPLGLADGPQAVTLMCHVHARQADERNLMSKHASFKVRNKWAIAMDRALFEKFSQHPGAFLVQRWGVQDRLKENPEFLTLLTKEFSENPTSVFVRNQPDKALILKTLMNPDRPADFFLLEEKYMGADLSKPKHAGLYKDLRMGLEFDGWADSEIPLPNEVGAMDLGAWDTYSAIVSSGAKIALVVYCNFSPAKLLMDWLNPDKHRKDRQYLGQHTPSGHTDGGSGKTLVRMNMRQFRPMVQFMVQEMNIQLDGAFAFVESCLSVMKDGFEGKADVSSEMADQLLWTHTDF